jgi:hypothetical protein
LSWSHHLDVRPCGSGYMFKMSYLFLLRSKSDPDDMCAVKIMSSEINNHPSVLRKNSMVSLGRLVFTLNLYNC